MKKGKLAFILLGRAKYCRSCGTELTITCEPIEYDAKNGLPVRFIHKIFCPNSFPVSPALQYLYEKLKIDNSSHDWFSWIDKNGGE